MMMTNTEPSVNAASRYSINETAALLGITRGTLRKYTNLCYIRCGYHKPTLRKFYTGLEIVRFWRSQIR